VGAKWAHRQHRVAGRYRTSVKLLRRTFVTVGPWRVHARVSAKRPKHEAPKVILVHGLGVSGRYLIPTAQELAPDYPVYIPDLPGFGRSSRPREVLDIAGLADALAAWMRVAKVGPGVLVGNSMGCQIITEFAIRHPQLALAACFLGPTMDPQRPTALGQILGLVRDHVKEGVALNLLAAYDYLSAGPARTWKTFRYALAHRMEQRLPLVKAPVLVVRGERDSIVTQRWAEQVAQLLPCATLSVVPEYAHAINFNAAPQVAWLLRPFLEQCRNGLVADDAA